MPAAQRVHESEPAEAEYCPAAHEEHELSVWLESDWNRPAAHERQRPPSRYCPLEQLDAGIASSAAWQCVCT